MSCFFRHKWKYGDIKVTGMENVRGMDLGGQFVQTDRYEFDRYEQPKTCTECGLIKFVRIKDVRRAM
jgi:hypothetical protein